MSDAENAPRSRTQLLRLLGVSFGVAVMVGNMIGSGILRAPNIIAIHMPDTRLIIGLWILGAVNTALGVSVYAELGVALPRSGGPYVYAHRAFGDIAGLIVGWSTWLSKLAGTAAAAVSFANFLPLLLPSAAMHTVGIAVGVLLLLFGANILGLREGRVLQEGTSFIKALMLGIFILAVVFLIPPSAPISTAVAVAPVFGWAAVIGAYQLIRGAYSGWDAPLYFTEENTAPSRSIPRSLAIGLVLTSVLYVGVNAALLYALGTKGVAASALPFTTVLNQIGGGVVSILFALTAMITVASCANADIMSAPRILYALAHDKLLPGFFQSVNKGGSPTFAFYLTGIGAVGLALSGTFETIFGLIGTLDALGGVLVLGAFFMLRRREPDLPRPFRAYGYPVLPALALILEAILLVLFTFHDLTGALFAGALSAACVPFAIIARRANKPT